MTRPYKICYNIDKMKQTCPIHNNPQYECEYYESTTSCACSGINHRVFDDKGNLIFFTCPKYVLGLQIKEKLDITVDY